MAYKFFLYLVANLFLATGVQGQHVVGNGGGGFRCSTTTGDQVEMLDIYEGREFLGLTFPNWQGGLRRQLQFAYQKLARLGYRDLAQTARQITAKHDRDWRYSQQNSIQLDPPEDAMVTAVPHGCNFVGVFEYFDRTGRLLIDTENYRLLQDQTNVAAGLLHEGIYWHRRSHNGDTDSRITRRFVACALSTDDGCSFFRH